MYIVFIDSTIIAVFILVSLMAGAGVTDLLINILNKHQTVLIVFMVLSVAIMSISSFLEIRDSIKKIMYIVLNMGLDYIIQIGALVLIFTELEANASSFDKNFIGMIFLFIPAIIELFFVSFIAIAGGYWIPAMLNKKIVEMNEMNISGFKTIITNIIWKVIYGTAFLSCSYLFMQAYYPNSYNSVFQGTIYDLIVKIPALWIKELILLV